MGDKFNAGPVEWSWPLCYLSQQGTGVAGCSGGCGSNIFRASVDRILAAYRPLDHRYPLQQETTRALRIAFTVGGHARVGDVLWGRAPSLSKRSSGCKGSAERRCRRETLRTPPNSKAKTAGLGHAEHLRGAIASICGSAVASIARPVPDRMEHWR